MCKELNNIQDLKSAFISHCKELGCDENYIKVCENKFSNIETALKKQVQDQKKLKKYQKAKELISKILDVGNIDTLEDFKEMLIEVKEMHDELFELPINYQNQLKAFEIIKDMFEVWEDNGTYHIRPLFDIARITQEEYNLLKEVLL